MLSPVTVERKAFRFALDGASVTSRSSILITYLLTEEARGMGEDGLGFHGAMRATQESQSSNK